METIKTGEIEALTIVNQQGTKSYYVGWSVRDTNNCSRKIAKILDKSVEFPDSLHLIYWVVDQNNELIATVENCPVNVEYKTTQK